MKRLWVTALALLAAGLSQPGHTHSMPNSTVVITVARAGKIGLAITIPISELRAAEPGRIEDDKARLDAFVHQHVAVRGSDQHDWIGTITKVARGGGDHPLLRLSMRFAPARGGSQTAGTLRYDAVIDRIASHYVFVYRHEGGGMQPLVRLQAPDTTVDLVDRR